MSKLAAAVQHVRELVGRCDRAVAEASRDEDPSPIPLGLILGSGLGGLVDRFDDATSIPFAEIPGFETTAAAGHRGLLVVGNFCGVRTIAMSGRFHLYQGCRREAVVFPVQLLSALGVEALVITNAAGGIHSSYRVGDLVILDRHIDSTSGHPGSRRRSPRDDSSAPLAVQAGSRAGSEWPPRFGGELYCRRLAELADAASIAAGFRCHRGTYLMTTGPSYETRAEYRMMRTMGADLAGMSTVPEVLAAARLGMRVLALSMVSNLANPDRANTADHGEVLAAGESVTDQIAVIVAAVAESVQSSPAKPEGGVSR